MINLPEWVHAMVDKAKSLPENDIIPLIRNTFKAKGLRASTTVNYISQLQTLMLQEELLTKRVTIEELNPQTPKDLGEARAILMLSTVKQYRLWQKLQKRTPKENKMMLNFRNLEIRKSLLKYNNFNADLIEPGLVSEVKEIQTYVQENPTILSINDGDDFVNKILRGFEIGTLGSLFCALMLACGRRPSTFFLYPNSFTKQDDEFSCLFTENLKVRDQRKTQVIPLLVPFAYFEKKLLEFHRLLPIQVETPIEVNKIYEKDIIRWVDMYVPIKMKPYLLRAIYARIVYDTTSNNTQHPLYFFRHVLIHDSINSSISYDKVKIYWSAKPTLPFNFQTM